MSSTKLRFSLLTTAEKHILASAARTYRKNGFGEQEESQMAEDLEDELYAEIYADDTAKKVKD